MDVLQRRMNGFQEDICTYPESGYRSEDSCVQRMELLMELLTFTPSVFLCVFVICYNVAQPSSLGKTLVTQLDALRL